MMDYHLNKRVIPEIIFCSLCYLKESIDINDINKWNKIKI